MRPWLAAILCSAFATACARPPQARWTQKLPSNPAIAMVAGQGQVFLPLEKELRALDLATGAQRWSLPLPEGGRLERLSLVGSRLYIYSAGQLQALDAATGKSLWSQATTEVLAQSEGRVCVAQVDKVSWLDPQGQVLATAALPNDAWATSAVWSDTMLMVGFRYRGGYIQAPGPADRPQVPGEVVGFDTAAGVQRWSGDLQFEPQALVQEGGRVYVVDSGLDQRQLFAFNAADGKRLWSAAFSAKITGPRGRNALAALGALIYTTEPIPVGQVVALGVTDGAGDRIAAFKAASGEKAWTYKLGGWGVYDPRSDRESFQGPKRGGQDLYFIAGKSLGCLSAEGKLRYRLKFKDIPDELEACETGVLVLNANLDLSFYPAP